MKIFSMLIISVALVSFARAEEKTLRFYAGESYNCVTAVGKGSIDSVVFMSSFGLSNSKQANMADISKSCVKSYNHKQVFKDVSVTSVSEFIKPIREEICKVVKPGSVKVGLGVDADGKIFGVGLGANGTIEVTFDCK